MNTILWIMQALIAAVFLYSGIQKSVLSERQLVAKGQTGVEGLSPAFIHFIGIAEIVGVTGIILPLLLHVLPWLTVLAALCLGFIMIPAAVIHYRRHEYKNVVNNIILLLLCLCVAWGRAF